MAGLDADVISYGPKPSSSMKSSIALMMRFVVFWAMLFPRGRRLNKVDCRLLGFGNRAMTASLREVSNNPIMNLIAYF